VGREVLGDQPARLVAREGRLGRQLDPHR
jgi:hypothetical protein